MKHLILQELHLENFQKFQNETFTFAPGRNIIRGENRAGKTTVLSAMLWLLFGKDAYGQTDTGRGAFDIKRREHDGAVITHTDVTVQGIFQMVDGGTKETFTLKRILHECWNKKNEYTGDETQCFVNDVPYKVGDYQEYINSIIPEEEFRMISTVGYFNTLKTDFKRNYLCAMGGVQSMDDIVAQSGNRQWKQFLSDISGKTLDEAIKQLSFERKQLKKQYESIDPQIQSLEKVKPHEEDWFQIDEEITAAKTQLAGIEESLQNVSEAMKQQQQQIADIRRQESDKRQEFYNITRQLSEARQKALTDARNELYKKDEELRNKKNNLKTLEEAKTNLERDIESYTAKIQLCNRQMQEFLDRYNEEQAQVFTASEDTMICPLLKGHICQSPELARHMQQNREQAMASFNTSKQQKLELIMKEGRLKKEQKTECETRLAEAQESLDNTIKAIEALHVVINSMPVHTDREIDESSIIIPGKEQLEEQRMSVNAEIIELEKKADQLAANQNPADNAELKRQKAELNNKIEELIRKAANRDQIDKINLEIDRLNTEGKRLAQQINALDQRELTAKDISRAIMEDATERVNKLFDIVTWQMFELQKNGLYAEVCKPCVNGISNSLNTEARINIGIDICNAISTFRGLTAPLFIDNAESVNELLYSPGQRIEMSVAPQGTKLTINNF